MCTNSQRVSRLIMAGCERCERERERGKKRGEKPIWRNRYGKQTTIAYETMCVFVFLQCFANTSKVDPVM